MSSIKLTADSGGGTVEIKAPATTTSNGAKQLTLSPNGLIGITEADQWRVTSSFSSAANPVTSNWERNDTSFDKIGIGMDESSAIFSFPSTGIWRIDYQAAFYSTNNSSYSAGYVKATTNNSSYSRLGYNYNSVYVSVGTWYGGTCGNVMFDVTSTSTHKVSLEIGFDDGNCMASSTEQITGLTFTRLGDT